jgi:hypothetical protein
MFPRLHAECDVAALVYGATDDPDAILLAFIRDLRARGFDAVGLLQRRTQVHPDICKPVEFFLMPNEDQREACWEPQITSARSCSSQLQDLCVRLGLALERQPDIIALNRFGWLEVCGSGLLGILGEAIEKEVPVVIAVPGALFGCWLVATQGLAVRLRCNRISLDCWWGGVCRWPSTASPDHTFCECYK